MFVGAIVWGYLIQRKTINALFSKGNWWVLMLGETT